MHNRILQDTAGMRAVFYARVSTEEEAQLNAIVLQIEENKQEIQRMSWVLVDQYVDEGKSGTQVKKRDEYQRLLNDMDSGRFDIIVVKDQERLQRNTRDWYLFVDRLVSNGLKLYFYLENRFFTPSEDALITGIKAIMAEEYSRNLSKKLHNYNDRRLEKARMGDTSITLQGSGNAYGWDKKDGKYTINPEQYKVKRLACELVLQGKGSTEVSQILNNAGYRNSRGKPWKTTDVPKLVYDIKNTGTLILNRERRDFDSKQRIYTDPEEWVYLENALPPIVTLEEWERLCQIKKERTTIKDGKIRGKKKEYLFTGKIFCGLCGAPYWHKQICDNHRDYWTCSTKQTNGRHTRKKTTATGKAGEINPEGCDNGNISTGALMEALEIIADRLKANTDQIKADIVEWLNALKLSIQRESSVYTEEDLEREKSRKDRLLDSLLDGIISKEDYQRKAEAIESKIKLIDDDLSRGESQLEDIKEIDQVLENIDAEVQAYVENNMDLRREFLLNHFDRVVIYEDKILVFIPVIGAGVILENIQFVSRRKRSRKKHNNSLDP